MIVEERVDNFVNIYVGGMVFTSDVNDRIWTFGDGDNTEQRWLSEAERKSMSIDAFKSHYRELCNAAAGWPAEGWSFRYEVVALDGWGSGLLREIMDNVTEAIERNKAQQDRKKCNELLRRTASLGVIRRNGLTIRKYIFANGNSNGTIVYQMEELSPYHIQCLIPEKLRQSVIHKSQIS